jgi:hypothetical protein
VKAKKPKPCRAVVVAVQTFGDREENAPYFLWLQAPEGEEQQVVEQTLREERRFGEAEQEFAWESQKTGVVRFKDGFAETDCTFAWEHVPE